MKISSNTSQSHEPMPEPTAPWSIELDSDLGTVPVRTSTGASKQPKVRDSQEAQAQPPVKKPSLNGSNSRVRFFFFCICS